MESPMVIHIIGAPVVCESGFRDSWREVADWAEVQLIRCFGESVEVKYYNLFDPGCPEPPPGAGLPPVLVGNDIISSGGKISVPAMRRYLEATGLRSIHQ